MAYNRQERVLSGKKQSASIIRKGKPEPSEGFHGDLAFVELDGIGVVQYVKIENAWRRVVNHNITTQAQLVSSPIPTTEQDSENTDMFIKKDGTREFTGNQSHGGNDITNVNNLDVNGLTTLDSTEIVTDDGHFEVSGTGNITLSTQNARENANIFINSNNGKVSTMAYLVSPRPSLETSLEIYSSRGSLYLFGGDVSISMTPWAEEEQGWGSEEVLANYSISLGTNNIGENGRFILTSNVNGMDADGIVLSSKTSDIAGSVNRILIDSSGANLEEEDKEGLMAIPERLGIEVKSDFGMTMLSYRNFNINGVALPINIFSQGRINISSISALRNNIQPTFSPPRTKIHGLFEISQLYRPLLNRSIITDIGWLTNYTTAIDEAEADVDLPDPSTMEEWSMYPVWDGLDTNRLMRAHTNRACAVNNYGNSSAPVVDNGKLYIVYNKSNSPIDAPTGNSDGNGNPEIEPVYLSRGAGTDWEEPGTVWLVTVYFRNGSTYTGFNVGYVVFSDVGGVALDPEDMGYTTQYISDGTLSSAGTKGMIKYDYSAGNQETTGIYWENDTGSTVDVWASALKIQSGTDFYDTFGN
tara:strand:+ start:5695 stop:7449 length:1755 start_codon:yes stop_codon:yes gene_type:complete